MGSRRSDTIFMFTNIYNRKYKFETKMGLDFQDNKQNKTKQKKEREKRVQNMYQFAYINIFQ